MASITFPRPNNIFDQENQIFRILPTIERKILDLLKFLLSKDPGGGTPYNGLGSEAQPERGPFLRFQMKG